MNSLSKSQIDEAAEVLRKLPAAAEVLASLLAMQVEQKDLRLQGAGDQDQLLAPKQAAAILNASPSTLEKWRRDGKGPAWIKLEGQRTVRYRKSDLLKFIASRKVEG